MNWPKDDEWRVSNQNHPWASNDFNMWNNDYDKQKIRNVNTIRKNRQGRVKLIEKNTPSRH